MFKKKKMIKLILILVPTEVWTRKPTVYQETEEDEQDEKTRREES